MSYFIYAASAWIGASLAFMMFRLGLSIFYPIDANKTPFRAKHEPYAEGSITIFEIDGEVWVSPLEEECTSK